MKQLDLWWPKCGHIRTPENTKGITQAMPGGRCRRCQRRRDAAYHLRRYSTDPEYRARSIARTRRDGLSRNPNTLFGLKRFTGPWLAQEISRPMKHCSYCGAGYNSRECPCSHLSIVGIQSPAGRSYQTEGATPTLRLPTAHLTAASAGVFTTINVSMSNVREPDIWVRDDARPIGRARSG